MADVDDPEFDALADGLAALAASRGASAAVIVMMADDEDMARGSGCTCDACLGRLVHLIFLAFGDRVQRHGNEQRVCH